jgi:hypothetical protein
MLRLYTDPHNVNSVHVERGATTDVISTRAHWVTLRRAVCDFPFPKNVNVFAVTRAELETLRAQGRKLKLNVVGLLVLADDVSVELALATIEAIQVRGIFQARAELKQALAERSQ